MIVCGDMLTKMVEPLIIMTPSPTIDETRNGSALNSDFKRLPITEDGKLAIPQPWLQIIQENKNKWKEQSALEEIERKKRAAEEEKLA
uniref:Uncharacterized protein n=1 Tax=Romanomermis culicivorax TaxID=13658 RepID=A0A915KFC7_ROMCU